MIWKFAPFLWSKDSMDDFKLKCDITEGGLRKRYAIKQYDIIFSSYRYL